MSKLCLRFNTKHFVLTTYAQKVSFDSVIVKDFEKFHFSHYAKIDRIGSFNAEFQ